jgi:hypothetical protein
MQEDAQKRHQELIDMIETLSDESVSETASTVNDLIVLLARTDLPVDKPALLSAQ